MIPLHLKLSGFISYRDPVELDLSSFDLACISGPNGAGKSSLLDAITWVLFGQARKRDDSVVNLQSKAAEVTFTFEYEGAVYRVIRSLVRGKTTTLEFQIRQGGGVVPAAHADDMAMFGDSSRRTGRGQPDAVSVRGDLMSPQPTKLSRPGKLEWRPLTERTTRDTQARIEGILRLDYETFVNAAFFLQGKADQFTQQPPARRKELLSNILGLEMWEVYKERAAGQRKLIESDLDMVDGRLNEIETELTEEPQRTQKLAELETELKRMSAVRKTQEAALANVKQARLGLDKQKEQVRKMAAELERARTGLSGLQSRLVVKQEERATHAGLVSRAAQVESAYTDWQASRTEVERLDAIAVAFHQHDERRQPLLREIEAERARLEQEKTALSLQESTIREQTITAGKLEADLVSAKQGLAEAEAKLAERENLQTQIQAGCEQQGGLRAENVRLKTEMDDLKVRIKKLEEAEGAACPLCGQSLSPEHRASTLAQLNADGKSKGDQWRTNKTVLEEITSRITELDSMLAALAPAENERMGQAAIVSQFTERLENLQRQDTEWKKVGAKRLAEVEKQLAGEKYATEARKKLAKVDKELAVLGYDAAAHDAARRAELQRRVAEAEFRKLESARAALKPLDDEVANLTSAAREQELAVNTHQKEYDDTAAALAAAESQSPDLESAERTLFDLQEQENRLNQEVGAARQKVTVLDDLRKRRKKMEIEREEFGMQIGRYRALERAFGKDGVPALLIEQALPEIETKANEILDRLSDGTMSVRFVTQSAYKDKKREDLKETLDIQISDGAGMRDYEMYSGGEAFRANFAIRLALSEVLAQRKGARLQTLVIDEGFGSQDTQGRQRLIESINAVRSNFARILVITHLDELKDAFPTRIEVEKTERGSTLRVI